MGGRLRRRGTRFGMGRMIWERGRRRRMGGGLCRGGVGRLRMRLYDPLHLPLKRGCRCPLRHDYHYSTKKSPRS